MAFLEVPFGLNHIIRGPIAVRRHDHGDRDAAHGRQRLRDGSPDYRPRHTAFVANRSHCSTIAIHRTGNLAHRDDLKRLFDSRLAHDRARVRTAEQ